MTWEVLSCRDQRSINDSSFRDYSRLMGENATAMNKDILHSDKRCQIEESVFSLPFSLSFHYLSERRIAHAQ